MLVAVLFSALTLQGCIALLTATAIAHSKSRNTDYAVSTLKQTPDEVYEAELKAMGKHPEIKIIEKDPKEHTITAKIGNDEITTQADATADGGTKFKVLVTSPDPLTASENPALDIEKDTLSELKVEYRIEK
jgi:hypothetical protein